MARRPKAVVICFFPAFTPPFSGGEMRLGELYSELSVYYDIRLVTSTDFGARLEEVRHRPGFIEYRCPKDEHWRRAYSTLDAAGVSGDLAGLAFLLAVSDPLCALRQVARRLAEGADVIIHEFPFSEPIFADGSAPNEIYNAHNFEVGLLPSIVKGTGFKSVLLRLFRAEGNLIRRAARVFATSPEDARTFKLFYGAAPAKVGLCPNGFADAELSFIAARRSESGSEVRSRPCLLFTGSGHLPNAEAAEFILNLAVALPECDIVIAGGVCSGIAQRPRPENVTLHGPFTAQEKVDLLVGADIYLNPVILGSGTSLKALDCLGSGIPIVSTPEGVRGLGLVPDLHGKIVARADIVSAIREVLNAPAARDRMALHAREYLRGKFTWARIAQDLVNALGSEILEESKNRPLILALNDYPVLSARSGGEVRIRRLLANLGCDVILLTFGSQTDFRTLDDGLLHFTVAKSVQHLAFEDKVNRGETVSANDAVAALFVGGDTILAELVASIARRASAIVFEHPYMAAALDVARAVRPDLPVVYSSHNLEATHRAAMLSGHPLHATLVAFIDALESRLADCADLVVCCSESDARRFASPRRMVIVVPNGCDMPKSVPRRPSDRSKIQVGFLGSSHTPNVVAARFVAQTLVPAFPHVQFEFVGGVCDALADVSAPNVVLHGLLPEGIKSEVLQNWDLALNPIEAGGGSSLKLPDYMAHGLATLNTAIGARSFDVELHKAGCIAPLDDFVNAMSKLIADREHLIEMGENALSYAKQDLAWTAITDEYRRQLTSLLASPPTFPPRRLLVVTYRFTEPALGGAEEYLVEVLERLRPRFDVIDLAAVDVERITNLHHFGCALTPGRGAAGRIGALFDHTHYFASQEPSEEELIARSRALERIWAREDFDLFRPFVADLARANELRLLCGFFGLEVHEGKMRRWTAPRFSFLLPAGAAVFRMSGWGSTDKTLRATLLDLDADGVTLRSIQIEQRLRSFIDVTLALPEMRQGAHRVLEVEVDEHTAPGDHRPFGILLEAAHALVAQTPSSAKDLRPFGFFPANFAEEIPDKLRVAHTQEWVAALRDTALRRDPAADADFAAARGPHAPAMQDWLARNAGNYDCVLVQGMPFDVIPRTVQTLAQLPNRPRIVTLPHFHGDDRFYHWRSYFEAFEAADSTLLFSDFLAEQLGAREKFAVVPGGGVRLDEITELDAEAKFREVHKSDKPFFLVLGRKTASKGYETAIRAHRQLRASRPDVELVLIGPDDDGRSITGEGVYYHGRQPRGVVRGALASCLALVTMSQSESFGIVICEAWLFGKPVIANANCYSFRELVREGETGLLVSTEEELALAMEALTVDERLRLQMGNDGFRMVSERYRWESVAETVFARLNSD